MQAATPTALGEILRAEFAKLRAEDPPPPLSAQDKKELLRLEARKKAGLIFGERFQNANFDLFPEQVRAKVAQATRKGKGVFLVGDVGKGKTSLLCCLAKGIMRANGMVKDDRTVILPKINYVKTAELIEKICYSRYGYNSNMREAREIERWKESFAYGTKYLFIDDLNGYGGSMREADVPLLASFIDFCYTNNPRFFVASNMTPAQIKELQGETPRADGKYNDGTEWARIIRRLKENSLIVQM